MDSFAYRLQRLEAGVVLLDDSGRIRSLNHTAEQLLGYSAAKLVGQDIAAVHPPASRGKLSWILQAAREQQGASMAVTLPGRVLLLKATALAMGEGICLTLYPVDEEPITAATASAPAPLLKLPVSRGAGVALLPLDEVVYLRAEGHYTIAATKAEDGFCPLALSELEDRLDRASFLRVHRSYIVNLHHTSGVQREDGRTMLVTTAAAMPLVPVSRSRLDTIRRLFAV